MKNKALKIEVLRGNKVESIHSVIGVVARSHSTRTEYFGDVDQCIFPRSALKPIQTLPVILSGAADAFKLSSEELALACASHSAEDFHLRLLKYWLRRIGLSESDLECGAHAPINQESLYTLLSHNQRPSSIHNNCSGKHLGMLTTCLHLREPTKQYVLLAHPAQKRIQHIIEKFCALSLSSQDFGIDGCSIPAPFIPLPNLALAFQTFVSLEGLTPSESMACQTIFEACVNNPYLTAGTGLYCSEIMAQTPQKVLLKGGAEGVMIAAIPEEKIGIAIKTLDGNKRASELAMSWLLNRLGYLSDSSEYLNPIIYNWNRMETGRLRLVTH